MRHILTFVSILIFSLGSAQQDSFTKQMTSLFDPHFTEDIPGGSVLIKKGNEIRFQKSYGLADLETREKIDENTIFNTGSISKTFVSNAILILQERGLLSVTDPIIKYFPDFDHPEVVKDVTIRHLLAHNSGIPDIRNVRNNPTFFLTAKDAANFEPLKRVDKLNFQPGARFQYSNPAYNGIALIIEQVSGQKWQDFIKENIFKPAGMVNSTITDGPHPESGVSHAYIKNGDRFEENDYGEVPTFAASGNGGIWSSVVELARYEEAILNEIFLSKSTILESRTPWHPASWNSTESAHIGQSWFIGEKALFGTEDNFGVDIIYHTGSQGGFRAFYILIPEKDILYVALFNAPTEGYRQFMREGLEILKSHNWFDN